MLSVGPDVIVVAEAQHFVLAEPFRPTTLTIEERKCYKHERILPD